MWERLTPEGHMGWGWLAGVDTDVAMPPVVATPTFWEDLRGGGALLQVVGGVSLVVAGLWFEVWVAIGSKWTVMIGAESVSLRGSVFE